MSTTEQVQSVVSAARFPPAGIRGFGSPFTQASWGMSANEYLKVANEGVVVLTQVETREAFDNIEAICAVEGLGESSYTHTRRRIYLTLVTKMACSLDLTISLCHWDTLRPTPTPTPKSKKQFKGS